LLKDQRDLELINKVETASGPSAGVAGTDETTAPDLERGKGESEMTRDRAKEIIRNYFDWSMEKAIGQNPQKNPEAILVAINAKIEAIDINAIDAKIIADADSATRENGTMFIIEKFAKAIMSI